MKRLFLLILATVLVLSLVSCKGSGGSANGGSETEPSGVGSKGVTLEGIDIEDLTIVIAKDVYMSGATTLAKKLSTYNGHVVPTKTLDEVKDSDGRIILIGASSLDGESVEYHGLFGYRIRFFEDERVMLTVDFSNASVLDSAVDGLIWLLYRERASSGIALTLREKDFCGYSFEDKLTRWVLDGETVTEICDGVTYTYQHFTDGNGYPYCVYVLKVDPTKAYLYTGTSLDNYSYTISPFKQQSVMRQINSAIDNGINPVAGINGDFFGSNDNGYYPLGLCIKEGTVVAKLRNRPWCGYTYDGQFVCGDASLYSEYEGKLRSAVGASKVLVSEGAVVTNTTGGEHPRTLAGVSEDGTIIFAVIDGRQDSSNGASYAQCAALMRAHGAYNAVNLDGGGSSTMIVYKDGKYDTVNSPSDGVLRRVYNSLLVVPIEN